MGSMIATRQTGGDSFACRDAQGPILPLRKHPRANDSGLAALKAGDLAGAFAAFTEAIRLCPTSPVYHCNRASVALQLEQYDIAASDARHVLNFYTLISGLFTSRAGKHRAAIAADPKHVKGYLRAAVVCMKLRQAEDAIKLYRQVLTTAPGSAAAKVLPIICIRR